MIELSAETEALIRARAAATGRTPDEVIRRALDPAATESSKSPLSHASLESRTRALDQLVMRLAAAPTLDTRSADEITGFDEYGVPK